jgi:hypothetical protein
MREARAAFAEALEITKEPTEGMIRVGDAVDPYWSMADNGADEFDCVNGEACWSAMHAAIPRGPAEPDR